MATPNIVPNFHNEGKLGKSGLHWAEVHAQTVYQNGQQVAPLNSPSFSGTPTSTTPATADDSTKVATTAWVRTALYSDNYLAFSSMGDGAIAAYNIATGKMEEITNMATLIDRSSHTGTQSQTTVTANATLALGGSTSLQTDLVLLSNLITDNTALIGQKANLVHTHTSSQISDASFSPSTPSTVVLRGAQGQILTQVTVDYTNAITGSVTATLGAGIYGYADGSQAVGVKAHSATGSSGEAAALVCDVGTTHTKRTVLVLSNATSSNPCMEFGVGSASSWVTWGFITKEGRLSMKSSSGGYQTLAPSPDIYSDELWNLPDNSGFGGTLVGSTGAGVSPSFRTALGLATGSSVEFATVQVQNSTSDGLRLGALSRLAMQSASSATTWKLPSGGGASETLVDGEGRGVSNAALFRTAIGVVSSSGGTFTGTVTINPASGSNQLQLVGAGGFTATLSANPTAARSISFPDAAGTLVVGNGSGITDPLAFRSAIGAGAVGTQVFTSATAATAMTYLGAGTTGVSLFQASTATSARSILNVDEAGETLGFVQASEATSGAVTDTGTGLLQTLATAGFSVDSGASFTVPSVTSASIRYDGSVTKRFLVNVHISIMNMAVHSQGHEVALVIGKNGSGVANTQTTGQYDLTASSSKKLQFATSGILQLATNDTVEVMVQDLDGSPVSMETANVVVTITPV